MNRQVDPFNARARIGLAMAFVLLTFVSSPAYGANAVTRAIESGNDTIAAMILEAHPELARDASKTRNPLLAAVRKERHSLVKKLLAAGANPNVFDDEGNKVLDLATGEIAKTLGEAGARGADTPHRPTQARGTAGSEARSSLWRACAEGKPDLVKTILKSSETNLLTGLVTIAAIPADATEYLLFYTSTDPLFNEAIPSLFQRAKLSSERLEAKANVIIQLAQKGASVDERSAGFSPLDVAAAAGDDLLVRTLLDLGARAETYDAVGNTPLHHCAIYGTADSCRALLKAGAKINAEGIAGATPLMFALGATNLAVAEALIGAGAKIEVMPKAGLPALHLAAIRSPKILKKILQDNRSISIDVKDTSGKTALNHAALSGASQSVAILLDHGADRNVADVDGFLPLHSAIERGDLESVKLLISTATVDVPIKDGRAPLCIAAEYPDIVRELLNHSANPKASGTNRSPLFYAAMRGSAASCKALLEAGADPTYADKTGTAFVAALHGFFSNNEKAQNEFLREAAKVGLPFKTRNVDRRQFIEVLEMLVDSADVNWTGADNEKALHLAAKCAPGSIIAKLIAKGASVKAQNRFGNTPLHLAALNNPDPEAIQAILAAKPPLNSLNFDGTPPIVMAASGTNLPALKALVEAGANVEATDRNFATALHWAARAASVESIDFLLAHGASAKARDFNQGLPLHIAFERPNTNVLAKLLGDRDIDDQLTSGETPLTLAIHTGDPEVVRFVLERRPNPNRGAAQIGGPLGAAVITDHPEIFELLVRAGSRVDSSDASGSPLTHFAKSAYIARRLVELGLDPFKRSRLGYNAFQSAVDHGDVSAADYYLSLATNRNAFASQKHADGTPPLILAAKGYLNGKRGYEPDYEGVCELLIQSGADVNLEFNGLRPIHVASRAGNSGVVESLLRHGASVNARGEKGMTALLLAVMEKRVETARILVLAGADPGIADDLGISAISIVRGRQDRLLSKVMELYGKGVGPQMISAPPYIPAH